MGRKRHLLFTEGWGQGEDPMGKAKGALRGKPRVRSQEQEERWRPEVSCVAPDSSMDVTQELARNVSFKPAAKVGKTALPDSPCESEAHGSHSGIAVLGTNRKEEQD
jgi:hypothetical protein